MIKSTFRYAVVGIIGTLLHFGLLYVLVEGPGAEPVVASTAGFIAALIASYLLNRYWTFGHRTPRQGAFVRYSLVSILGLGINTVIMFVGTHILDAPYLLVQLTAVFVVPAVNFTANYLWSFRDTTPAA